MRLVRNPDRIFLPPLKDILSYFPDLAPNHLRSAGSIPVPRP